MLQTGTYRGTAEGLIFEFRLERSESGLDVSGDITRGTQFLASFLCDSPAFSDEGRSLAGPVTFRGNAGLYTGTIQLSADERGIGSFQIGVDLESGYRDLIAGRLDWQGGYLRRLVIELDGLPGTQPPRGYRTRTNRDLTIERAFEDVGFDVSVAVDRFPPQTSEGRTRGYSLAEIHVAMERLRSDVPADRLHAHVFVCSYLAGRGNRGVLGVMYDFDSADLNRQPREGVAIFYDHPMLSDPRIPESRRDREYVYTIVHEVGHALNLLHSFDKARPAALSWMNYPHLFPRGYEAGGAYDGTDEFWRRFDERFDEDELRHLRHASPREIRAGGFPFGTYEEGASVPFGGTVNPRRTVLGANPLRAAHHVGVQITPAKREYDLAEPIFLKIEVKNNGVDPVHVPDALDPSEGYLQLIIRHPSGRVIRYRPPIRLCKQAQLVRLAAHDSLVFDGASLVTAADGPLFTEPGTYILMAQLAGVDDGRTAQSEPTHLRVRVPDRETERVAEELWTAPSVLKALYMRQPLIAQDKWNNLEETIARHKLPADNTMLSYMHYVAGIGWMTPFDPGLGHEYPADRGRMTDSFRKVHLEGLPQNVANRVNRALTDVASAKTSPGVRLERRRRTGEIAPVIDLMVPAARAAQASPDSEGPEAATADRATDRVSVDRKTGPVLVVRSSEKARVEIPPAGLFGTVGIAVKEPTHALDPFARIVPSLRGTTQFADLVSWNIEHFHSKEWKIPRVAELIRAFRCDFWGLQEVDEQSLTELAETINSAGRVKYGVLAAEGAGQQSGVLYRTDTTRVRTLPVPAGLRDAKLEVTKRDGSKVQRKVFLRDPLLCEVAIQQSRAKSGYDFRCAVVHFKSTDTALQNSDDARRREAARHLGQWIAADRELVTERDYIIMGDMNAETAQQGLSPLQDSHRLLSIGMRDRYGLDQALTRVALKRLIDHIVITDEAQPTMLDEDLEEQLIIRADLRISDWTEQLSDHVPVAVRFIRGADAD